MCVVIFMSCSVYGITYIKKNILLHKTSRTRSNVIGCDTVVSVQKGTRLITAIIFGTSQMLDVQEIRASTLDIYAGQYKNKE